MTEMPTFSTRLPLQEPGQEAVTFTVTGLLAGQPCPFRVTSLGEALSSRPGPAVLMVNGAVQLRSPLITTSPELLQSPPQPSKWEPGSAVAFKSTNVPLGKISEQSPPQLMPGPVTLPLPDPILLTVRE